MAISSSDVFGIWRRLITPILLVYMPLVQTSTSSTTDEGEPNNFPGFDGQDPDAAAAAAATAATATATTDGAGISEEDQDRADEARYNYNHNRRSKDRTNLSPIWKFFSIDPSNVKKAHCLICKATFSRGGDNKGCYNTTNLARHMRRMHIILWENAEREHKEAEQRRMAALHQASSQTFFGRSVGKKSQTFIKNSQPNKIMLYL